MIRSAPIPSPARVSVSRMAEAADDTFGRNKTEQPNDAVFRGDGIAWLAGLWISLWGCPRCQESIDRSKGYYGDMSSSISNEEL